MKYKCLICEKETSNHINHIKFKHKIEIIEYFNLFNNEIDVYNKYMLDTKEQRKALSPNSIEFYKKKGYSDIDSQKMLNEYRVIHPTPFLNKKNVASSIEYWENKGFCYDEAKKIRNENQSHTLKKRVLKYGEHIGIKKHNETIINHSAKKWKIIENYKNKYNLSSEEAKLFYNNMMILKSQRRTEYWLNKGYSDEEAMKFVSEHQRNNTDRNVLYWTKKGFNDIEAKLIISKLQDNTSINAIKSKFKFNDKEAFEYQVVIYKKILNTKQQKNMSIKDIDIEGFKLYKIQVEKYTRISWKYFAKGILNSNTFKRSREYHLDHKLSCFEGFKQGILPSVIGSPNNLELIHSSINCSKSIKSNLSYIDLVDKFNKNEEYIQWIL